MTEAVDLTETSFAILEFHAKWDIEAGYDYVQVMAADGTSTWTPLEGKYTKTGNSNQAEGEPVYDGQQEEWVKEEISLEQFCGSEINLRFVLKSDSYVTGDGFYWDDMKVVIVDMTTNLDENNQDKALVKVFPNPARDIIYIDHGKLHTSGLKLSIYNLDGRRILEQNLVQGENRTGIDISEFSPGLYFYHISGNNNMLESGKILVQ
jgi:bacillopeptidase F (M6 metalloprotease family)